MKRIILGVGVAGIVFGGVFAAASQLEVKAGNLQAGGTDNIACQATPISASWGVDDSQAQGPDQNGNTTFVSVSGVNDAACSGDQLFGRVDDASGHTIGYTTLINDGTGAAETYAVPAVIGNTSSTYGTPAERNPETVAGTYKLQLITTTGTYGVDPSKIARVVFWVAS